MPMIANEHELRPRATNTPHVAISVVIPVYNEELNVEELYQRLARVLQGDDVEFLFVDDGSSDRTYERLEELVVRDSRVQALRLRRNFGQTAALSAAIDHSRGD